MPALRLRFPHVRRSAGRHLEWGRIFDIKLHLKPVAQGAGWEIGDDMRANGLAVSHRPDRHSLALQRGVLAKLRCLTGHHGPAAFDRSSDPSAHRRAQT
ncbi:MAG: hypothetical protein AAGD12_12645, partial [Pseudomonadota bacterium]